MMSIEDKYKKFQFTMNEREEILNCVKEYFQLTKDERSRRRNLNNEDCWFKGWLPDRFDYKIKVESWADELKDIDLDEIERIYLNENYYELLPFNDSLTYTDEVMSKYLKNKSNDKINKTINRHLNNDINNNRIINQKTIRITRSTINNDNQINKKTKNPNSLIKQRLINERIWLNEQANLNNQSKDLNSNYLNDNYEYDLNDDNYDKNHFNNYDKDYPNEDNLNQYNEKNIFSDDDNLEDNSINNQIKKTKQKIKKKKKKIIRSSNRIQTKSIKQIFKLNSDLCEFDFNNQNYNSKLNTDFSDTDDLIIKESNQDDLHKLTTFKINKQIYFLMFFIILIILINKQF